MAVHHLNPSDRSPGAYGPTPTRRHRRRWSRDPDRHNGVRAALWGVVSEHRRADLDEDGALGLGDMLVIQKARSDTTTMAPTASPGAIGVVRGWLDEARARDDGSGVYRRGVTALAGILASMAPKATALLPNYPNPFNPETWIPFDIAQDAEVTVRIYNFRGDVVRRLELGALTAGAYRSRGDAVYWDGRNDSGEQAASGVYITRVATH